MTETGFNRAARIEGGYDAVVLGGGVESLTAAAYLGRAGLSTLLLDPEVEVGAAFADRVFAEKFEAPSFEHLVYGLDPRVVRELSLYRHGLAFAARRLETTYFAAGEDPFILNGDVWRAKDSLTDRFPDEATDGERFLKEAVSTAEAASFVLSGDWAGDAGAGLDGLMTRFAERASRKSSAIGRRAFASATDILAEQFASDALRAVFCAEATFRYACEPGDDYSFLGLLKRLGGEVSGLRAAIGYPEHGMSGLIQALRRSAQAAGVEFRTGVQLSRVLIEWDGAAGVELADGGQVRCPIVVSGLDAARTFVDLIGPAELDIELQDEASRTTSGIGTAKLNLAISPEAAIARDSVARLGAPARALISGDVAGLGRAFAAARRGSAPDTPTIEAVVLPTPTDDEAILTSGLIVSAHIHPTPAEPRADVRRKVQADAVQRLSVLGFDPLSDILTSEIQFPSDIAKRHGANVSSACARPPVFEQLLRARLFGADMKLAGFRFCGVEAEIGVGVSGAAGRRAAKAAVRDAKRRRRAA